MTLPNQSKQDDSLYVILYIAILTAIALFLVFMWHILLFIFTPVGLFVSAVVVVGLVCIGKDK